MPELHLLKVLFGTNLNVTSASKHKKDIIFNAQLALFLFKLMQILMQILVGILIMGMLEMFTS